MKICATCCLDLRACIKASGMDLERCFPFDIASSLAGFLCGWPALSLCNDTLPHRGLDIWAASVGLSIIWRDLRAQEAYIELQRGRYRFSVDPTEQE